MVSYAPLMFSQHPVGFDLGPVQSLISAKQGLTLEKTCTVNLGLALIQL